MRLRTRVPITFEGADGRTQHAPLVMATIGGRTLRFVLDTGSDVHLINLELADDLGLDKAAGEDGLDHGGATIPSWTVGAVAIDVGTATLELRDVVAVPAPRPFHDWGVGGIIAPQMLDPAAAAVIDLVGRELMLVDGSDTELEAFLRDRVPDLTLLRLERDRSVANVMIPAAIAGYPEIPTLVDTGGKRTEVAASAVPGLLGAGAEALGRGVGGTEFAGSLAGAQTLVVGGRHRTIDDLAVRPGMHGAQMLIGMDVLGETVLACAADLDRPVFWLV